MQRLPPGSAAVVCGDFNTGIDSDALRCLTCDAAADTAALRLAAVPVPPGADGAWTTWKFRSERPGDSAPSAGSNGGNGNGNGGTNCGAAVCEKLAAIDHVLHSAALVPVAAWAAPSKADVGPGGLPSDAYPSDHVAQLVELQWL